MTIREVLQGLLLTCQDLDQEARVCIIHREMVPSGPNGELEPGQVVGYQYGRIYRVRFNDTLAVEADDIGPISETDS